MRDGRNENPAMGLTHVRTWLEGNSHTDYDLRKASSTCCSYPHAERDVPKYVDRHVSGSTARVGRLFFAADTPPNKYSFLRWSGLHISTLEHVSHIPVTISKPHCFTTRPSRVLKPTRRCMFLLHSFQAFRGCW